MAALRILLLTFISHFVIDFLSIRKVIIFSVIATDGRHSLRSRSIHQNAANCMTIRFRYIAGGRTIASYPGPLITVFPLERGPGNNGLRTRLIKTARYA